MQAGLIWRGEKNRGHNKTVQGRAGARSFDGGGRRRNDFERGKRIWPAEGTQRDLSRHRYTVDFLPKIKFEIVIADDRAQRAVEAILEKAKTGKIGDGKIFVTEVEEAVRIRTSERGMEAL